MMKDTIYRQDAIELAMQYCPDDDGTCSKAGEDIRNLLDELEDLPSAQPEQAIKDCRNCKYGSYNDHLNSYFCYYSGDCNNWDKWEPSVQPDFDMTEKIDKAYDDGYEQGYLQGKADYEPKTGKWIKVHGFCTPGGDPVWVCSECGKGVHVYGIEHGTYGADVSDGQWKACPNCGCIMEGEKYD